jgi:hypothetical protein
MPERIFIRSELIAIENQRALVIIYQCGELIEVTWQCGCGKSNNEPLTESDAAAAIKLVKRDYRKHCAAAHP